jgi:hypothetical protein
MFSPLIFRCRAHPVFEGLRTAEPFHDGVPAKSGAPSQHLKNSVMNLEDVSRILHASGEKEVPLPTDDKDFTHLPADHIRATLGSRLS